jgi:hypothetical protein
MLSVCMCARFQAGPKEVHLRAVKRIMRYLVYTLKFGLWYPKGSPFDLIGYSYADWAGCKIDRKSTSGTCQFLGRSLLSWASKKQKPVALSTAEAEYIVVGHCCAQLLWMRQTLRDYGYKFSKVPLSYVIMRVQSTWGIIPLNTVLEPALLGKLIQRGSESNVNKVSTRDGNISVNLASQGHCMGVFIGA